MVNMAPMHEQYLDDDTEYVLGVIAQIDSMGYKATVRRCDGYWIGTAKLACEPLGWDDRRASRVSSFSTFNAYTAAIGLLESARHNEASRFLCHNERIEATERALLPPPKRPSLLFRIIRFIRGR